MKQYNLLFILDKEEKHILMCKRIKEPYKGKYNMCGGKIEKDEDKLKSAYRELYEETGITKNDITLKPFMSFNWYITNTKMYVYIGKLENEVPLKEELHPLKWININENFFNLSRFAGEGNIGHMVEIYKKLKGKIFYG